MRDAELGFKSDPAARHTERSPGRASDVRDARRERISGFTAFGLFFLVLVDDGTDLDTIDERGRNEEGWDGRAKSHAPYSTTT